MKICFNLFPPVNKMIALLVCILLILTYTKLRAENRNEETGRASISFTHIQNDDLEGSKNFYSSNRSK